MPKIALLADFSEEYFKKILLGIARYSKENGPWVFCRMPIYYREKLGLDGIIRWATEWGATGMLAQLENIDDTSALASAGFPIVVTDLKERFANAPNITGNYMETGAMGAEYFLKKGYNQFAYYGYSSFVWSRERGEGFAQRLNRSGHATYFFNHDVDQDHEMWYYKPSTLSSWLEQLPKPIALMACDDNCGQQVTEACKLIGIKIPEELAVLGVDNDELICNLSDPQLSSISLDAEQGGYEAAQLLDRMMRGQRDAKDIIVRASRIITRQSTDIYATSDTEIAKALKFIHQNYDRPIEVKEVLQAIALSRRSFEIRFKKTTQLSIYQYILKLRIEQMALKLHETNQPISEIASSLGMLEIKNVSRLFKQFMGCTPGEYRKKIQNR